MDISNFLLTAFAVLAVISLLVFVYFTWSDRHERDSGQNNH